MAFHVACPITCKRICFCSLGFPNKLQCERGKIDFVAEIQRIEDFLKDPWLFRVKDGATVQVPVPKLPPPPPPPLPVVVDSDDAVAAAAAAAAAAEEELSAQTKRAALQKKAAVASLAAEDFARRFESGALEAPKVTTVEEQGQVNANVNVMCRLCFSGENEGSERAKKMLPCRECGKKYHRNCLKTWSQHRDLFHWSSWACPTCRICEVCRRHGDSNKFKFCKRCDGAFHCYCMQPPHKNVSSGPYLCPKHTKCHSCESNVPGNGLSVRWFLGYTCCDACGRLFTKGNYCPVCLKVYRDSEATPMVCCDICQRWVHCQCDGISEERYLQFQVDGNLPYTCPTCRGEFYQVRDLDDAVQELWRRRDEADRDLITSLRAAKGLPTQDEIFYITPFSDDEDNGPSSRSAKFSYRSLTDGSPKKVKESGKKKKYPKKKGHLMSLDSKIEEFPEDHHHDPQSFRFARGKEQDVLHTDGPNLFLTPVAENFGSPDRKGPIKEHEILKHRYVDEINGANLDRRATLLPVKVKTVSDAIISEDAGKVASKSKAMKGTKLVIHLGGRNKTIVSSPRSDSSSYQREQELMTLSGGNEAVSQHRMGEHLADRIDGVANSEDGYRVDNPRHSDRVKPRDRNIIKLGKGKLGVNDSSAISERGNGSISSKSTHLMSSKRHNRESTAVEGLALHSVSTGETVSLRRHPENRPDISGSRNESRKPVSSSLDASPKESRPLLRLKFKSPLLGSMAPLVDEEMALVKKGQRSKRKRPSIFVQKPKLQEEDVVIVPDDDVLTNEIMDANWILKRLGRDAIGKRVTVHQPSDNSWHNGVISDVEGSSLLYIDLDDGRAKTVELGKQGIRIVPQKQKRLKS
ncbi:hypothetical protein RND81_14G004400 [Saponaria officinalis]|uniref:Uncharacterized protein n=1 Tax=Saponaria officinalis TaxID=3572 RepID=A0AAW1GGS2_SAPOF